MGTRVFVGVRAALWLAAVCVGGPAAPAQAHAELTKSIPATGASLSAAPLSIQAWFSEELKASGSYLP